MPLLLAELESQTADLIGVLSNFAMQTHPMTEKRKYEIFLKTCLHPHS